MTESRPIVGDEQKEAIERVRYRLRSGQSAWLMQPKDPEWKDTAQVLFAFFESQCGDASRARKFPLQPNLRRDAAPGPLQIPWSIAEKAYGVYASRYGRSQTLERLAERGGFYIAEMDDLYPSWRAEVDRITELEDRLQAAQQALRDIVCTEGEDRGVVLVDGESRTHYDPALKCHVYEHDNFSPLGDALIGLWEIITGESQPVGVEDP